MRKFTKTIYKLYIYNIYVYLYICSCKYMSICTNWVLIYNVCLLMLTRHYSMVILFVSALNGRIKKIWVQNYSLVKLRYLFNIYY